jgi:hypothetical protein
MAQSIQLRLTDKEVAYAWKMRRKMEIEIGDKISNWEIYFKKLQARAIGRNSK